MKDVYVTETKVPQTDSTIKNSRSPDVRKGLLIGSNADYMAGLLKLPLGTKQSNGVWVISNNKRKQALKLGAKVFQKEANEENTGNSE